MSKRPGSASEFSATPDRAAGGGGKLLVCVARGVGIHHGLRLLYLVCLLCGCADRATIGGLCAGACAAVGLAEEAACCAAREGSGACVSDPGCPPREPDQGACPMDADCLDATVPTNMDASVPEAAVSRDATLSDGGAASEDIAACGLEFALCLIEDPLGYAECARVNAQGCDLLGSLRPSGGTSGTDPSSACLLQLADCIMRDPAQTPQCFAMVETCTL
ncbi:MAG: hypothetical protein OXR73_24380 [Myxococcales bacterium]|nr:hypothetical protein [Myxococcales bacterium]